MFSATGTDGLVTVTPGFNDLTTRLTLTAGPGLAFDRSRVATRLLAVSDWMVSAKPVTLTVVLVGGLITIRFCGTTYWIGLTVSVLNVGGFWAKATTPTIKTDNPTASSLMRQLSMTQLT